MVFPCQVAAGENGEAVFVLIWRDSEMHFQQNKAKSRAALNTFVCIKKDS